MKQDQVKDFLGYIDEAVTPYHAVLASETSLKDAGFIKLNMDDAWSFSSRGRYYVTPAPSMLVAFTLPTDMHNINGFKIIASHCDFPCFKIKPIPETINDNYIKLNTEVYGGPIFNTWFDRVLSIAGLVTLKSNDIFKPRTELVDFKEPLLTIPNLAYHFNLNVNKGVEINAQKDLPPILGLMHEGFEKDNFLLNKLAGKLGVEVSDILDFDLFVYLMEEGSLLGINKEFISSPRLDNLAMVYTSIHALIDATHKKGINIAVCFDHEEVGSTTRQGADNSLLAIIIERILMAFNKTKEQYYRLLENSFMISADAAHAVHPNVPEIADASHKVFINKGITIKYSGKKRYATDAESAAVFKQLCNKAEIPLQKFVNRSDLPGGQTLGPLAEKYLPVRTVDVGMPMLAMHSARELIGTQDFLDTMKVFNTFYTS